jgi:O-antigen/teichoic acid export membrane protein
VTSESQYGVDTSDLAADAQGLARSAFWRISSRVVSSVAFGLTLLLLARISSVSAFGQFMLAGSITAIAGIVLGFGAPSRVLQCAAENEPMGLAKGLYLLHSVANVGLAAVMLVGAAALGLPAPVSAGILWAAGDNVQWYAQHHLAGLGNHRASSWLVATQRLAPCATVVAYVVAGEPANYPLLGAAFGIPLFVGLIAPIRSVRGTRAHVRGGATGAVRWWALAISGIIYQAQPPVIAAVSNTVVLGLYALAAKATGPIILLPAAISTVIVPELARRLRTGGAAELYQKFSRLSLAYAVLAIACAWPAGIVVTQIAGPHYEAALPLVAGMVVAAGLSAYTQSFMALLIAAGHPNQATASIAAGQIVALVLLAILGAYGPIESLALAPIAAEVVVLTGIAFAVRRLRNASLVP